MSEDSQHARSSSQVEVDVVEREPERRLQSTKKSTEVD